MVKRIEYFDQAHIDILFDLIFSLKSKTFAKDMSMLEVQDTIEQIYFIEEGHVHVTT